jgi:hypothetical protein
MAKLLKCRTCGDEIILELRPGFIVKGQPRYFAINPDDRLPHSRRCKITMDLRAARAVRPKALPKITGSLGGRSPNRSSAAPHHQGELFK